MNSLNKYKEKTKEVCVSKGWNNESVEHIWMFMVEEIGELAGAIRRDTNKFMDKKKVNIEGEIMDVMSYLFQIADMFNVDLDRAWENHLRKKQLYSN